MEGFKVKIDLVDCISQLKDIDKEMFIKEIFDNLGEQNQKDVLSNMLDTLSGSDATELMKSSFDNLNEQGQNEVMNYVNDVMLEGV